MTDNNEPVISASIKINRALADSLTAEDIHYLGQSLADALLNLLFEEMQEVLINGHD